MYSDKLLNILNILFLWADLEYTIILLGTSESREFSQLQVC